MAQIRQKRTTEISLPQTISGGRQTVFVDQFTNGILDPALPMLGPVREGGHIVINTTPGCWGPMITPRIRGGHEVTQPVSVEGAEIGDAIAISIRDITVTSLATASGTDCPMEGRFLDDPFVAGLCPECGTLYPETRIDGIGQTAVRCAKCGADAAPFNIANGYTMVFDQNHRLGVTVPQQEAEGIARQAERYGAIPGNSVQHPILTFAPHDLVGIATRLRPFMGQLGTTPAVRIPDSHNAGDFGVFLIGKSHEYALTGEELEGRTDGHMDCDSVRAGAVLICPVKTAGAGVYTGDMHALQGDGEIAGHTCDVSGTVTLEVHVLKKLTLEGPILLPVPEDLPYLARPLKPEEARRARRLARTWGMRDIEAAAPISFIGTGPDLNAATDNGLRRAASVLDMSVGEVKNRATIAGAVEIARNPGVVQVTFLAPLDRLEKLGLAPLVAEQYGIALGSS